MEKARRLLERFTPFQIVITGLVLLLLILQIFFIVLFLRTRSDAQPLLNRSDELIQLADQGPYISQAMVEGMLSLAADELADLADSRIQYTFHISQTLPISTEITVDEEIAVPVSLVVDQTIPVKTEIPFDEELRVPVNLEIDQVFSIDATFPFQDEITVPIDDVIYIDEVFETRILGQTVRIPIRGAIPVKMNVTVPIDKEFPVEADIPVRFPISETLALNPGWTIPVDLEIPVNLPIETEVVVPFHRTIPINVEVPVVLDVPIDIAIGDTPLGEYLRRLAEQLR